MKRAFNYGPVGIVGLGTPQANPTVEAEMRILLPFWLPTAVVRLTSGAAEPATRLRDYLEHLGDALGRYDTLRPAVFGFACTGSTYLVGHAREKDIVRSMEDRFGFRIMTAAATIESELRRVGAKRLSLVTPYPAALTEKAVSYWRERGFDIVAIRQVAIGGSDTRGIYALGSSDMRAHFEAALEDPADAVLLSGTGAPTLALVADRAPSSRPFVFSSNLCLASAMCRHLGVPGLNAAAWRRRLRAALAAPVSEGE